MPTPPPADPIPDADHPDHPRQAGRPVEQAGPPDRPARPTGRPLLLALVAGLLLGLAAAWLWPPASLGGLRGETGDPGLAARARAALGERGRDSADLAEVRDGRVVTAHLGPERGRFELGSITKTFNGHLLADAVARGEVRLDDRLEQHLPRLAGSAAGGVTLQELATHTSGLPRQPLSRIPAALVQPLTLGDPYAGYSVDAMLSETATTPLTNRGHFSYSNLGASLLGHALATAAHEPDWTALVRTRLLTPLGMTETVFAGTPAQLPADRVRGHAENGGAAQPWTSPADLPAGCCTWTTAADMGRYAQAVLDGSVPGPDALTMRADGSPGSRIGLHWLETDRDGRRVVWHNGGTGGAATYLGIDPDARRAVVVLGTTTLSADAAGRALVQDRPITPRVPTPWVGLAMLAGAVVLVGVLVARLLRPTTRTRWLAPLLDAATITLLAWRLGPWQLVPPAVVGALAGVVAAGLVAGLLQARTLPWTGGRPVRGWLAVGASGLLLAVVLGLVVA